MMKASPRPSSGWQTWAMPGAGTPASHGGLDQGASLAGRSPWNCAPRRPHRARAAGSAAACATAAYREGPGLLARAARQAFQPVDTCTRAEQLRVPVRIRQLQYLASSLIFATITRNRILPSRFVRPLPLRERSRMAKERTRSRPGKSTACPAEPPPKPTLLRLVAQPVLCRCRDCRTDRDLDRRGLLVHSVHGCADQAAAAADPEAGDLYQYRHSRLWRSGGRHRTDTARAPSRPT